MRFQILALFLSALVFASASTETAEISFEPQVDAIAANLQSFITGFFQGNAHGYDANILVGDVRDLLDLVPAVVTAFEAENTTALFQLGVQAWSKYEETLSSLHNVGLDLAEFVQTDLALFEDVSSVVRAVLLLAENATELSYLQNAFNQAVANQDVQQLGEVAGFAYELILENIKAVQANATDYSFNVNFTRHDVEYTIWGFLDSANTTINATDYLWFIRNEHILEKIPLFVRYAYETKNITFVIEAAEEVYARYQALLINIHDLRNQAAEYVATELPLFEDEAKVTRAVLNLLQNETAMSGFESRFNYNIEHHYPESLGNVAGDVYNWIKADILSN